MSILIGSNYFIIMMTTNCLSFAIDFHFNLTPLEFTQNRSHIH